MELLSMINYVFTGLGFAFLLPLVVLVMALILGVKFGKALISSLTIGVGFIGIGVLIGFFIKVLGPAAAIMVRKTGVDLGAVDVGWAMVATSAFGTPIGVLVVPVAFVLNLLMLKFGWTKTFNLDIWNFWHFAFTASIVYVVTKGSITLGLIAASIHCVYTLVIADLTAKKVQQFFNVPGVSVPQGWLVTSVPIIWILNWIVDKIPGLKDVNLKPEGIIKKMDFLGQPIVLGILLGIIFGLIAYGLTPSAFVFALQISALMLLTPILVPLFKEGLTPVSEASQKFMDKHFKEQEHYQVMDYGVLMGHPNNGAAGLLLMPITLVLAFLLPGSHTLPLADLAITAFFIAMIPPLTKGNLFRSFLYGIVIMALVLYISSSLAPDLTMVTSSIGMSSGESMVTSLAGGNWVTRLLMRLATIF